MGHIKDIKDISEDVWNWAHELRVIVLMEDPDFKHFRQVCLDQDQFKKVSAAIAIRSKKIGRDTFRETIRLGKQTLDTSLFEGMNSVSVNKRLDRRKS